MTFCIKKGMQTENGILKHLGLYYTAYITAFFSIFTATRLMSQYINKFIYNGI